ncbi:hypothetical protein AAZX31_11G152700 [Glycine max]
MMRTLIKMVLGVHWVKTDMLVGGSYTSSNKSSSDSDSDSDSSDHRHEKTKKGGSVAAKKVKGYGMEENRFRDEARDSGADKGKYGANVDALGSLTKSYGRDITKGSNSRSREMTHGNRKIDGDREREPVTVVKHDEDDRKMESESKSARFEGPDDDSSEQRGRNYNKDVESHFVGRTARYGEDHETRRRRKDDDNHREHERIQGIMMTMEKESMEGMKMIVQEESMQGKRMSEKKSMERMRMILKKSTEGMTMALETIVWEESMQGMRMIPKKGSTEGMMTAVERERT